MTFKDICSFEAPDANARTCERSDNSERFRIRLRSAPELKAPCFQLCSAAGSDYYSHLSPFIRIDNQTLGSYKCSFFLLLQFSDPDKMTDGVKRKRLSKIMEKKGKSSLDGVCRLATLQMSRAGLCLCLPGRLKASLAL